MLQLDKAARETEQGSFHLQRGQPIPTTWTFGPLRVTTWTNLSLHDGAPATFVSRWCWKLQWYSGTAKCDGTRSTQYAAGQLDDGVAPAYTPLPDHYVMTTKPSEMTAFRWRKDGPGAVHWNNMGGS